ncbi:MAG: serine/threonine protein kinase [Kiritimatiellales bacterium]|nr:serine/threonine protein kinase [Kiritimatiellales bacterium]
MAEEIPNQELERDYLTRVESLRDFYQTDHLQMTEAEQASLTPILNSLKDQRERYEEVAPIAEGGEKKVSRVYDRRLDRCVAMARAARAKNPQDQEQFLREARLTANLAHPNILPVYNMGVDPEGTPFFSMELVSGDSLKDIIRKLRDGDEQYKQEYPLETLLNIFLKICDAITYAHARNVLHLDLKPDNIRVGHFGEVFVCDWGLARVIYNEETSTPEEPGALDGDVLNDMTLSGTMKGTPGFMAPEQTEIDQEKIPQTDVYSLGAMLYMMLTYELPVDGSSANEVVDNTRAGSVIPPRRRKTDRMIPAGLEAVTMKALALNPADRYKSVAELQMDTTRYLTGYPTLAENADFVTRLTLLIQRHSRLTFLLMFFLILLAVIVSVDLISIRKEKAEAVAARQLAEENFKMYTKEVAFTKQLGEDLDDAVLYTVQSRDYVNAESMIPVLERGLTEDLSPDVKKNLLIQKGTLHFVLQQFNMANSCFEQAGESKKSEAMWNLSKKYAEIKPNDSSCLSDQQMAKLFNDDKPPPRMTVYYMYHHHMKKRRRNVPPEKYLPLAGAILDKLNGINRTKTKPLKLVEKDGGNHLNLSGSQYSVYSLNILGVYRRNVLVQLKLSSLDISRTPISRLSELKGLKLKELSMVGLDLPGKKINLPKQLEQVNVEKIVVGAKDYPPATIAELRKKYVVEFKR